MNIHDAIAIIVGMQKDGVIERYAIGGAIGAAFYIEPAETQDVEVFFTFATTVPDGLIDLSPIYR
ncbi:MAG: hypothetical protein HY736_15790 [Verrucomicrobia bacterium]|nr:hypothetical protein [Verrucomicrobiota bacterium]